MACLLLGEDLEPIEHDRLDFDRVECRCGDLGDSLTQGHQVRFGEFRNRRLANGQDGLVSKFVFTFDELFLECLDVFLGNVRDRVKSPP